MRFITEFKVPETFHGDPAYFPKLADRFINNNEEQLRYEMGKMLQESFGWQNPVNGNPLHHRLEIEAFPMDKWIEFKNKLFEHITDTNHMISGTRILEMIKELEFNGTKKEPL